MIGTSGVAMLIKFQSNLRGMETSICAFLSTSKPWFQSNLRGMETTISEIREKAVEFVSIEP